uniref:Uncharacterized protein n=1 Tax=Amphimedon queenslandica TaxID=400682 RepID=A0A1X7SRE7_AMPQE
MYFVLIGASISEPHSGEVSLPPSLPPSVCMYVRTSPVTPILVTPHVCTISI